MKKIVLALGAACALGTGVPAQAQLGDVIGGIFGGGNSYDSRLRQLESRIETGVQRGTISRGEADRLWGSLQDLRARESQYDDNGYSQNERYDLDRRIADLDRRIADAERGGGYDDGYGGGWNGGGTDRFDNQIAALRDRVQQGVQNGRLTRGEAQYLRGRVQELNRLERRYADNGFSRGERDDLRRRIQQLRGELQNALRNGDDRGRYDNRDRDRDDD